MLGELPVRLPPCDFPPGELTDDFFTLGLNALGDNEFDCGVSLARFEEAVRADGELLTGLPGKLSVTHCFTFSDQITPKLGQRS